MAGRLSCFEGTVWSAKVAAEGNPEVAVRLSLEERTAKEHLSRISRKLGAAAGGYGAEATRRSFLVRILPQRSGRRRASPKTGPTRTAARGSTGGQHLLVEPSLSA